jgi:hypothetical protein
MSGGAGLWSFGGVVRGLWAVAWVGGGWLVPGGGFQVASAQVPSRCSRPRLIRFRRLRAAVRRLSQAWLAVTPR